MSDQADMFRELGEKMRSYRLDAGVDIKELSVRTRIAVRNIEALEEGRLDQLPGQAFTRGFIRSLCAELGRDPGPILESYERVLEMAAQEEEVPPPRKRRTLPLFLSLAALLVLIAGAILIHGDGEEQSRIPSTEAVVPDQSAVATTRSAVSTIEEASIMETVDTTEAKVPEPQELDLLIQAIERTWLRVQTDTSQPWETTMKTGDEIRLKASEQIRLLIGNAGGLLFELNGRRFGPPGSQGQVISDYVITRDNL